jgi:hypothetical protein
MGPELIIVALKIYVPIFAGVGLLMGIFLKNPVVLAGALVSMAAMVGVADGLFVPAGNKIEVALVAFASVLVVSGVVAGAVAVTRGVYRWIRHANL